MGSRGMHGGRDAGPEYALRREALAIRTITVTLRAAVSKTNGNPRLEDKERRQLVEEMCAWAADAVTGHASVVSRMRAEAEHEERLTRLVDELAALLETAVREIASLRGAAAAVVDGQPSRTRERRLSEA